MAFQQTLAIAKSEGFTVMAAGDQAENGGFLLSEENLNNIEAALANNEQLIATAQAAEQRATDAQAQLTAAQDSLATANESLATAQARIQELEQAAPSFSETGKESEEKISGENVKFVHPVTQELNRLRALQGLPPVQ